jgi:DNA-3-methyladenine glycosylase
VDPAGKAGAPLATEFFARPTLTVGRELLGMCLVRMVDGTRLSGIITETEAYIGEDDLACHARAGRTPRTQIMYGRAGIAYVYFTYGMHWLLNAVTEGEGFPAAVLIRAIEPHEAADLIRVRRKGRGTDGPAKLTQALLIDGSLNGADLTTPTDGLWIETGDPVPISRVTIGPRVGLYTVPEPWKSMPWRFRVKT